MELITQLGLDWRLLIGQIINFLIVLAVLYYFVYKPLLKILAEREKKISDSLKNAEKIEIDLKQANQKAEKIVLKAKKEADQIISQTKKQANQIEEKQMQEVEQKIEKMLEDSKALLAQKKQEMIRQIQTEISDLVVQATEKIINEKLTAQKDKELIKKNLENL